jgi:hypothetical protein
LRKSLQPEVLTQPASQEETLSDLDRKPSILCISTYEKGQPFLREAANLGCEVMLLTVDPLAQGDWPRDCLSQFFTMNEGRSPLEILSTVMGIARNHRIDRIVALDEFDLEAAALIREHMRLPGMGESTTRYFRDKLAMRTRALRAGIPVPEFTGVFLRQDLSEFMNSVPGPWLLKPRTSASAIGIRTIEKPEQLWPALDELGDQQSFHLLERFLPGEVYHVEGITWNRELLFSAPHKYGQPPMETMHQGGIFSTRALPPDSSDARNLRLVHQEVLAALGMVSGVTHTEFIKSKADGRFYFIETAARVGGAYIADVVQFASGINPWVEWARLEVAALRGETYVLPRIHKGFAGSVICLARQQEPDTSGFNDPEIVLRLHKKHHAGLIVRSDSAERVEWLIDDYTARFVEQFLAVEPPPDKPTA